MTNPIAQNISDIRLRMHKAALQSHREGSAIEVIAVSKTKDVRAVRQAIAGGHMVFGENRVQEATAKFSGLHQEFSALQLHLIGPLQTNKVDAAVTLFDVIQTLDRPKLAEALAQAIKELKRNLKIYIQVNIGRESQKAGIMPEALPEFVAYCRDTLGLPVEGLMCIPPHNLDPTPFFLQMKIFSDLHNLPHLSMGMSGDFEKAIACGATEVRIGSAIFGERLVANI